MGRNKLSGKDKGSLWWCVVVKNAQNVGIMTPSSPAAIYRDSRKSRKHGNHENRDFHKMAVILPKYRVCRVFGQNAMFLQ